MECGLVLVFEGCRGLQRVLPLKPSPSQPRTTGPPQPSQSHNDAQRAVKKSRGAFVSSACGACKLTHPFPFSPESTFGCCLQSPLPNCLKMWPVGTPIWLPWASSAWQKQTA